MPRDIIPDVYIDSPTVTLLRDAQARIQRGWIQRYAVLPRSGVLAFCAGGAIAFDDHGRPLIGKPAQDIARCALQLAINKLTRSQSSHISIVKFNDWYVRSQADVVQAYEVAIELRIRKEQG